MDARWATRCKRIWRKIRKHSQLTGFDLMLELLRATPRRPKGWWDRRRACNRCGTKIERHEEHDAYFCPVCRRWLEAKCGDPQCELCKGRPAKPQPMN